MSGLEGVSGDKRSNASVGSTPSATPVQRRRPQPLQATVPQSTYEPASPRSSNSTHGVYDAAFTSTPPVSPRSPGYYYRDFARAWTQVIADLLGAVEKNYKEANNTRFFNNPQAFTRANEAAFQQARQAASKLIENIERQVAVYRVDGEPLSPERIAERVEVLAESSYAVKMEGAVHNMPLLRGLQPFSVSAADSYRKVSNVLPFRLVVQNGELTVKGSATDLTLASKFRGWRIAFFGVPAGKARRQYK